MKPGFLVVCVFPIVIYGIELVGTLALADGAHNLGPALQALSTGLLLLYLAGVIGFLLWLAGVRVGPWARPSPPRSAPGPDPRP